ncbi:MAG: phosphate ABC transporter substrate-binding protein [Anaerolineae bacterium]|nr:phosphate ABC transporter substrate-binding protein [Anaerolineae bacterium]
MTDDGGRRTNDRRPLTTDRRVKLVNGGRRSAVCGRILYWLAIAILLAACAPPPRKPVQMQLVGSDSMHALAQSLAEAYTQQRPYVTITIRAANSAIGIRAAREYTNTIGLVARAIKPSELVGTRAVAIARDGVAVIVHPSNPINAIMRAQLVQVFSGEILVWPLGPMAGKPIVVVSREEGSGTRHAFETMAMQGTRVTLTAVVMPSEAAVVDYVARHPEAIGYVSMNAVTANVRALTIDDVPLARETVESLKYPFVRVLSFVVPQAADVEMQEFVAFVLSAEGQRIVAQRFGRVQ